MIDAEDLAFYVDEGDGYLVPEHASLEEALDDALTRVVRAGMSSVRVVHGSEVAGFDDVADVLLFDEYGGRQAIGEMHDLPEAVIVLREAGRDLTTLANKAPYTATFKYGPWRSGQRDDSVVAVILARDEQHANPPRKRTDLTSAEIAKVQSAVVEMGLGTLDLTPARGGKFVAKVAPLADAATIIKSLRLTGLDAEELKGEESGRLLVKLPKREPRAVRPSALPKPPAGWLNRPVPKDQLCYASRSDALKRFLDENYELIQNYGGVDYQVGASEFDAINHKYGLTGERAARTIADAVWYAMPPGKPYCVERIDLDALNGISAVVHGGIEFRLPDYVYDKNLAADEAKRYAQWREDALEEHDARLAEAEEAEAQRAFAEAQAPIPSLPAPISLPVPDGDAFIDAYIVPSHVVGTAYEPWMEDQLLVTRERRALVRPAAASNPGCATPNPSSEDLASATQFAEMLAATLNKHGLRAKAWSHLSVGARVYIGKGFLTISRGGDATNTLRHKVTLGEWELYPDQRRKYKAALAEYRTLVDEHHTKAFADYEAKENPSRGWVTNVIAKHYEDMQQEVPAKWLPKIASIKGAGGRKVVAQMQEYGCGAYGCVLPTYDPDVVLKLTTDDTEAEFAHDLASSISAPIVVKYQKTVTLPEKYHGHGTYLLWRQSADEVGNLLDVIKARKGNRSKAFAAIAKQHKAAQRAYDALLAGKPAHDKLDAWSAAAKLLGEEVPELRELMRGMIKVLDKDGVFFGDIHDGNLGLVNGKWLIVDPGHVAVITEDA
jgi:hypothetical protein